MDTRTGAEVLTTRVGALALPLGVILLVVSTIIHPSGEVMNNPVIFMVYAQDYSWIAVHCGQWFGGLLFFGGLVAVYYSITAKSESAGAGIRFCCGATVAEGASLAPSRLPLGRHEDPPTQVDGFRQVFPAWVSCSLV